MRPLSPETLMNLLFQLTIKCCSQNTVRINLQLHYWQIWIIIYEFIWIFFNYFSNLTYCQADKCCSLYSRRAKTFRCVCMCVTLLYLGITMDGVRHPAAGFHLIGIETCVSFTQWHIDIIRQIYWDNWFLWFYSIRSIKIRHTFNLNG